MPTLVPSALPVLKKVAFVVLSSRTSPEAGRAKNPFSEEEFVEPIETAVLSFFSYKSPTYIENLQTRCEGDRNRVMSATQFSVHQFILEHTTAVESYRMLLARNP
jgi:hypothetical protein